MKSGESFPPAILVVEDDQLLKMLTVDIVEGAGFIALQADNADQALVILAARPDIAVLLTVVSRPGSMVGLELAHAAHARWPLIKIIVVSASGNLSDSALPGDGRFFRKPYHTDVMISALQSLIGPGNGSPAGDHHVSLGKE